MSGVALRRLGDTTLLVPGLYSGHGGPGALQPSADGLAISFFPEHSLMAVLHVPPPGMVPGPEQVVNKSRLN